MKNAAKDATTARYVPVSLPAQLAAVVREQADLNGRSMATQVEHWMAIGRTVESIAPVTAISAVKVAKTPKDIFGALVQVLEAPHIAALRASLLSPTVVRFGASPDEPGVVLQHNPDGSTVRGKWGDGGEFVPFPNPRSNHVRKAKPQQQEAPTRRSAKSGHAASSANARGSTQVLAAA